MNAVAPTHLHRVRPISEDAMTVLQHLAVHGPSSRGDIERRLDGVLRDARVTMTNLTTQQYIAADHNQKPVTYSLTAKARARLQATDVPLRRAARRSPVCTRATKLQTVLLNGTVYAGESGPRYGWRPGADQAAKLPSRFGNTLRWPDGRRTDLAGRPVQG